MADVVTFIENRRKDRVLLRMLPSTPHTVVLHLFVSMDARCATPLSPRRWNAMPVDAADKATCVVSVPVPAGQTKHAVRRAIRAAAKPTSKPVISSSKRVVAAVGTSTRSYVGRRSQGN